MKVRHKLYIAVASMVAFMGSVFFGISHGYMENLFRQYANQAAEANAEQWARLLGYYYQQNGNSWFGVNNYVYAIIEQSPGRYTGLGHLSLYDAEQHSIVEVGQQSTDTHKHAIREGVTNVPIEIEGQKVGALALTSRMVGGSSIEQNVLQSMTIATVWGTIVMSLVALLIGAWLARVITRPLRTMTKTMHRITEGDLQARVDITSRDEFGEVGQTFNEMTDRLVRTEESRRHLVADVAHELRTPLTIIQGQLELIQEGVKKAEPETLLPIQDEVVRLTRLVQDLHQLTLAEVGKLPLEKKPTDIGYLTERIVENFQVEAEERQIRMDYTSQDADPIMASVDPNRITQVLVNLLGNALRYTPSEGFVRVEVFTDGDQIKIHVRDSGPGIPSEHLPHIFDRFYRAEGDRSRGSGGTGLGLAIAKEFVEAHQGRLEVASTVGEGTTFTVCLPRP